MVMGALRHYCGHPGAALRRLQDPVGLYLTFQDRWMAKRQAGKPQCPYQPQPDWEAALHAELGESAMCSAAAEFDELWPRVLRELADKGLDIGPARFYGWNDGDPEMVRAVWCLVRHLRPTKIVETGVARGLTSRFILEAMRCNGTGHLWSIDVPPVDPIMAAQVGAAVAEEDRGRWTYLAGTSRQHLPKLLQSLAPIDLFVHDSMHSEYNVSFEMALADRALRPGGAMVVDDIDTNWAFHNFADDAGGHVTLVCQSRPIAPDFRRFDGKGLFGIVVKCTGSATAGAM
jgi:predicted O-methyltransferase YrrM